MEQTTQVICCDVPTDSKTRSAFFRMIELAVEQIDFGTQVRALRLKQRSAKRRRIVFVAVDAGVKISAVDRIERGLPVDDVSLERITAWVAAQTASQKLAS